MARSRNPNSYPNEYRTLFDLLSDPTCKDLEFELADHKEALKFRFSWYAYMRALEHWYKKTDQKMLNLCSSARRFEIFVQENMVLFKDRNNTPMAASLAEQIRRFKQTPGIIDSGGPLNAGNNGALPPGSYELDPLLPEISLSEDRPSYLELIGLKPPTPGRLTANLMTTDKTLEQLEREAQEWRATRDAPEAPNVDLSDLE